MRQSVIIKSSKNGINLVLNPELPFDQLLEEILKKFHESERFFANAEFAISFEGRELSDEEQYQIVDCIMAHTQVKILCIIENNELRDTIIRKKMEALAAANSPVKKMEGSFYHGSLTPGSQIETDESIIIIGDVPAGASVISKSDIIVLGTLNGSVYAGIDGDIEAFIAALSFAPEQYNIAGIYGAPIPMERSGLFKKRNKTPEAKIAYAEGGIIKVSPLQEGLDNYI